MPPAPALVPGDPVVQELVAVLDRTSSPDTYVVTTAVLGKMGFAARPALPAVVRNGERLGVFKGVAGINKANEPPLPTEMVQEARKVVEDILASVDLILAPIGPVKQLPALPSNDAFSQGTYASPTGDKLPPPVPDTVPPPPVVESVQPIPPAARQRPKPPAPPNQPDRPAQPAY
jgi:hypothetical protein